MQKVAGAAQRLESKTPAHGTADSRKLSNQFFSRRNLLLGSLAAAGSTLVGGAAWRTGTVETPNGIYS